MFVTSRYSLTRPRIGQLPSEEIFEVILSVASFAGQLHECAALYWLRAGPGGLRRVHRIPQGHLLGHRYVSILTFVMLYLFIKQSFKD
jgi:hypothetical protein